MAVTWAPCPRRRVRHFSRGGCGPRTTPARSLPSAPVRILQDADEQQVTGRIVTNGIEERMIHLEVKRLLYTRSHDSHAGRACGNRPGFVDFHDSLVFDVRYEATRENPGGTTPLRIE